MSLLIPPEIGKDELGDVLRRICNDDKPKTILDVGASSGEGSTRVFRDAAPSARIFAIEMIPERFKRLKDNFKDDDRTFCYQGSSSDEVMSAGELRAYADAHPDWNCFQTLGYDEMEIWRRNTEKEIEGFKTKYKRNVIEHIKKKHRIERFDVVLLDGSPFTAASDYKAVVHSQVLILDDVLDPKNWALYKHLTEAGEYWCTINNKGYRNGYAVFEKYR